jgi:hypothetical protein
MSRFGSIALALAAVFVLGCETKPDSVFVQWVARDAWNPECAEMGIVERFSQDNLEWVTKGQRAKADVDATFKLASDCGELKAYQSFEFKQAGLELVRCDAAGDKGWALPGKESSRCWTGPRLLK